MDFCWKLFQILILHDPIPNLNGSWKINTIIKKIEFQNNVDERDETAKEYAFYYFALILPLQAWQT